MKKRNFFLVLAVLSLAVACSKEKPANRDEYIEIYRTMEDLDSPQVAPLDAVCVGVRAGTTRFYVKTNTDVSALWEDALESPWAKIVSFAPTSRSEVYELDLEAKRISGNVYYTRRSGTLFIYNEKINFGKFLEVHQGATARFSCNFSSLDYGNGNPLAESGEVLQQNWSASLKNSYKVTSTVYPGLDKAYLYGLKGYVRIGDADGHAADIITPYTNTLRSDSMVMASFKAIAYASSEGVKDASGFKVEVLGGGVIADYADKGLTEIRFEADHFDPLSQTFPSDMWQGSSWLVFIKSTENNPITADTRLRISTVGAVDSSTVPSRIFIDDIYLRRLVPELDEDYYAENNGSGPDIILGE